MPILAKPYFQGRKNNGVLFEPDTNTVLWLPGQDDPQSAVIRDRSGLGNNGTILVPSWKRNSQGLWYLFFDKIDDLVDCGSGASLDNIWDGGGTLECWINFASDGENNAGRFISKGTTWYIDTNNEAIGKQKITFVIGWGAGAGQWSTTATTLINNTWTHILMTFDSDNVANNPILYVNDSILTVGSGLTEDSAPVGVRVDDSAASIIIGNNPTGSRTVDGGMALERLYNKILTVGHFQQERHLFGV